jgi:hypothetical protein
MTTTDRELLPLHPFTLSIGGWHEDERKVIQQAIADAKSAGREQGLREAKDDLRALLAALDEARTDLTAPAAEPEQSTPKDAP